MASKPILRPGSRPACAGLVLLLRNESGTVRRRALIGFLVVLTAAAGALVYSKLARAAATVTTAANYTTNADTAANGSAPAWSGNLSIAEQVKTDFPNAAAKTVILDAPAGWSFNTAAGTTATGTLAPGGDFTAVALTSVTATKITVTVTTNNTNKFDTLTVSNVQVRPTSAFPVASGSISWDAASTFAINGAAGLNYGTLTENPAAASKLAVTTQPSGATAGAAFTTQPAVAIQDQYGSRLRAAW